MVDKFDLSREHFEKEWWRERRVAPATFFGFPDVTKHGLRGGSLYVEQMDSVTLAVLADKCLKEKIWDPDIWTRFCWRAQQIVSRTNEPDLCYIFRAFARADWFDQNLLTTYLGRLHRRLHAFQLPDTAVLLEAFANPKFRQSSYLQKTLTHLSLLLQHRDDATAEALARTCAAVRVLSPLPSDLSREALGALELLAETLLLRELSELGPGRMIQVLDCYSSWGLLSRELLTQSSASVDLCWALARELKGRLQGHASEHADDLGTLALAMATGGLAHAELWDELLVSLEEVAHTMSGPAVAAAAYGVARGGRRFPQLYEAFARRLQERQGDLSALDCARAAGGFCRCPPALAERVLLRGAISERALELGLGAFDAEAATLLLDSLSRAPPAAQGAELLAGALLEALHPRLGELSARQLASVARSLGTLRPASPEVLRAMLDRAQEAVESAASAGHGDAEGLPPRYVAMLCQGIAAQPSEAALGVPDRLKAMLPVVISALKAKPTGVTTVQLLRSLVHCRGTPERDVAVNACADRLLASAGDLSAIALVSLAETLAAVCTQSEAGTARTTIDALLKKVAAQLDMKRYDLPRDTLWRAARALELAGAEPGVLRLERRDKLGS